MKNKAFLFHVILSRYLCLSKDHQENVNRYETVGARSEMTHDISLINFICKDWFETVQFSFRARNVEIYNLKEFNEILWIWLTTFIITDTYLHTSTGCCSELTPHLSQRRSQRHFHRYDPVHFRQPLRRVQLLYVVIWSYTSSLRTKSMYNVDKSL